MLRILKPLRHDKALHVEAGYPTAYPNNIYYPKSASWSSTLANFIASWLAIIVASTTLPAIIVAGYHRCQLSSLPAIIIAGYHRCRLLSLPAIIAAGYYHCQLIAAGYYHCQLS